MDTTQNQAIRPGLTVYGQDGTKLGPIAKVEDNTALVDWQGQQYRIPLDAFGGFGSDHVTLNRSSTDLKASGWAT